MNITPIALAAVLALAGMDARAKDLAPIPGRPPATTGPAGLDAAPLRAGGQQLAGDAVTNQVGLRLFNLAEPPPSAPPSTIAAPAPATPPAAPAVAPAVAPAPPLAAGTAGGGAKQAFAPPPAAAAPAPPAKSASAPVQPAAPAIPPPAVQTRFNPSPAISQQVRQALLQQLSPQLTGARAAIAAGQPWQEFDQLLTSYGYSSHDLADVLTAYYIISWEVATGSDAARELAGIAAVRRSVAATLVRDPNFLQLNEAGRQVRAENLAYVTVLAASMQNGLRRQGRAAELAALRDQVAGILRNQGIDARRYRLTSAGFVAG